MSNSELQEDWLTRAASRLLIGIARHWLLFFNLAWGIYVGLPLLAPLLMQLGLFAPARMIYAVYSIFCHQLPDHSYFFFGQSLTPDLATLEAGGLAANLDPFAQRKFIGNELLGYKVAICERDIAIYGAALLGGLLFALLRNAQARWQLPILNWKWYILLLLPMAVDGTSQLVGLRQSDWLLRSITGALFGLASVWLAYPFVEEAMQDVLISETRRLKSPQ